MFRFRICNELLDDEFDEVEDIFINFTPSTFKEAKEKLKEYIEKTFPEFTFGSKEDWENKNDFGKAIWHTLEGEGYPAIDEPEEPNESIEVIGTIDEFSNAFRVYIEEVPETDLI